MDVLYVLYIYDLYGHSLCDSITEATPGEEEEILVKWQEKLFSQVVRMM
jgi:hypothetical protein